MTHSPISFTVRMSGPGIDGATTASRIFGAEYEVPIGTTPLARSIFEVRTQTSLRCFSRTVGGELSDWVDAGATNTYEIGCNRTRPNSTSA